MLQASFCGWVDGKFVWLRVYFFPTHEYALDSVLAADGDKLGECRVSKSGFALLLYKVKVYFFLFLYHTLMLL